MIALPQYKLLPRMFTVVHYCHCVLVSLYSLSFSRCPSPGSLPHSLSFFHFPSSRWGIVGSKGPVVRLSHLPVRFPLIPSCVLMAVVCRKWCHTGHNCDEKWRVPNGFLFLCVYMQFCSCSMLALDTKQRTRNVCVCASVRACVCTCLCVCTRVCDYLLIFTYL